MSTQTLRSASYGWPLSRQLLCFFASVSVCMGAYVEVDVVWGRWISGRVRAHIQY